METSQGWSSRDLLKINSKAFAIPILTASAAGS